MTNACSPTSSGAKKDNGYGQLQIHTVPRGIALVPNPYGPDIFIYVVLVCAYISVDVGMICMVWWFQ